MIVGIGSQSPPSTEMSQTEPAGSAAAPKLMFPLKSGGHSFQFALGVTAGISERHHHRSARFFQAGHYARRAKSETLRAFSRPVPSGCDRSNRNRGDSDDTRVIRVDPPDAGKCGSVEASDPKQRLYDMGNRADRSIGVCRLNRSTDLVVERHLCQTDAGCGYHYDNSFPLCRLDGKSRPWSWSSPSARSTLT